MANRQMLAPVFNNDAVAFDFLVWKVVVRAPQRCVCGAPWQIRANDGQLIFHCHANLSWTAFCQVHPETKLLPPPGGIAKVRCNSNLPWHHACPTLHKAIVAH